MDGRTLLSFARADRRVWRYGSHMTPEVPEPPPELDFTVLDDFLSMVGDDLDGRGPVGAIADDDYLARVMQVQLVGYEALARLGALLRDACGLPSVMHPAAPETLPEPWMDMTRKSMESLVDATWYLGQAARAYTD
jgi:hypothetical protein